MSGRHEEGGGGMALSQDDQRILAEIERRLASDDPGLATSLTAFRRPGPAKLLRSPRARIVGSLFTVLLVAMVSLTVYAMIPFRAHLSRQAPPTAGASTSTAISAATSTKPSAAESASTKHQSPASTGTTATASSSHSAAYTDTKSQGKIQPTNDLLPASTTP
jgi:cytoskeletal protein RodZ